MSEEQRSKDVWKVLAQLWLKEWNQAGFQYVKWEKQMPMEVAHELPPASDPTIPLALTIEDERWLKAIGISV